MWMWFPWGDTKYSMRLTTASFLKRHRTSISRQIIESSVADFFSAARCSGLRVHSAPGSSPALAALVLPPWPLSGEETEVLGDPGEWGEGAAGWSGETRRFATSVKCLLADSRERLGGSAGAGCCAAILRAREVARSSERPRSLAAPPPGLADDDAERQLSPDARAVEEPLRPMYARISDSPLSVTRMPRALVRSPVSLARQAVAQL